MSKQEWPPKMWVRFNVINDSQAEIAVWGFGPSKKHKCEEYLSLIEAQSLAQRAAEEGDKEWIREASPYLLDLFNQTSCHCGYFGEVDQEGEAIHSICAMCSLKNMFGLGDGPAPDARREARGSKGEGEK